MKKLLCLVLALLMLPTLCACGEGSAATQEKQEYYVLSRYMRQPTGDVSVTEYDYDENWTLLRTATLLNGNFASAVEYVYSEDKTQLTMNYSSAINEPYSTQQELEYNEQGRIKKATVIENGEASASSEYFYDEAGREIKVVSTAAGGYKSVIERVYDKNGSLLRYSADTGYSVSRQEYSYDDAGRLVSLEYYLNDKLESLTEYSHEDNVRHGTVCDAEGKVLGTLMEVLDGAGNVLESERLDALGNLQSYTCTVYVASNGSISGQIPD